LHLPRQWHDTALRSVAAIDADVYGLTMYPFEAVHMRILQDCHAIEYTDTPMSISAQLLCLQPWHCLSSSEAHHINANALLIFHRRPRSVSTLQKITRHVPEPLSGYRLSRSRQEVWPLSTEPIGCIFMQVILANGSFKRAVGSARVEDEHPEPLV
jgi:hypothetical protein